jgi:NADPH2:quinone reductase
VVLNEFGPPENLILTEVPDPVPGPGEVLVDVRFANITFVETQLRAGRPPYPPMAPRLPVILGNGVAGVIEGQQVISTTGGKGGYAERTVVPVSAPIPVPAGLTLADAVALLADGRTATALIRAAALRRGETVLVEAAAGGVGSLLVQLARNAGAQVIAAAGGPRKLALAKELGADVAVDYTEPAWAEGVAGLGPTHAGLGPMHAGLDVVFDGVGGPIAAAAFGLLRRGGRMLSYGAASGSFAAIDDAEAARRGVSLVRGVGVSPQQMTELTIAALTEAAAGRLRPVTGQTFPLERAADAHAAIERRETVGKTLLTV